MTSPKIGMTVQDIHNVYSMDVATPARNKDTRRSVDGKAGSKRSKPATTAAKTKGSKSK